VADLDGALAGAEQVQRLDGLQAILLEGGEIEGSKEWGFHGAGSLAPGAVSSLPKIRDFFWGADRAQETALYPP